MAKVKMARKSVSLDMTAMCDMAFLLLNFFILTAKFKPEDPVTVDTPSSISELKAPDIGAISITIDKDNRVFFGVEGQFVRQEMLKLMAANYKVGFSDAEIQEFGNLAVFGVPFEQLRGLLHMSNTERNKPGLQTGIPLDSANNQLKDWIAQARYGERVSAMQQQRESKGLSVLIRGDQKTNYPTFKKVVDILQKQNINKFKLVTSLEGAPAVANSSE